MRVAADQGICVGSGQCVLAAPKVFDQRTEDAVVELLDPTPPPSQWLAVRDAVAGCPVAALKIHDLSHSGQ
ncbi:ferredoxin [Nocardia sp. NPDC088792]|uniref:ferredoxin n=1 Tax=Nocardia sp. NPDC088792 TaxID=3364332 RepID=UPI0037F8F9EC